MSVGPEIFQTEGLGKNSGSVPTLIKVGAHRCKAMLGLINVIPTPTSHNELRKGRGTIDASSEKSRTRPVHWRPSAFKTFILILVRRDRPYSLTIWT